MTEIPLSLDFILEKLKEINFSQISQEDQHDYARFTQSKESTITLFSLILALDNNHYSRYQFKQELMEVFSKDEENEEEKQETKTKIDILLQEIYKYKLKLHQIQTESNIQNQKKALPKQEPKKAASISIERKYNQPQNKEIEGEKKRISQFKRASEQAAASVKQTKDQRNNSLSQQKLYITKSAERPQKQIKQIHEEKKILVEKTEKQGILSRIKKHTEQIPEPIKKVKKEELQTIAKQLKQPTIIQNQISSQQQQQNQEQEQQQQQQSQQQVLPEVPGQFQQMQQFNQIYQMMLSTMQSQTKQKPKQKIRCKFWPNCKDGENCQFHHPTEKCIKFPNCPYGSQCLYMHPEIPCKFGIHCKRPNCVYSHKPQAIKTAKTNQQQEQTQEKEVSANQNEKKEE